MFIVTVVLSVLLALAAIGSAAGKLTRQQRIVDQLTGLGVPLSWFSPLAGAEIAGGVGILVGLGVPALGIAAAIGLALYFVGAVITHVRVGDKEIAPPAVLAAIAIAVAVLRAATA